MPPDAEQSPSGWSEVPWHTCCDPVILAAPYVIDLHHDTVARDQLAHLAEVLHEYLEKNPGVVDSAWVRQQHYPLGSTSTCGAAWALAFTADS